MLITTHIIALHLHGQLWRTNLSSKSDPVTQTYIQTHTVCDNGLVGKEAIAAYIRAGFTEEKSPANSCESVLARLASTRSHRAQVIMAVFIATFSLID